MPKGKTRGTGTHPSKRKAEGYDGDASPPDLPPVPKIQRIVRMQRFQRSFICSFICGYWFRIWREVFW